MHGCVCVWACVCPPRMRCTCACVCMHVDVCGCVHRCVCMWVCSCMWVSVGALGNGLRTFAMSYIPAFLKFYFTPRLGTRSPPSGLQVSCWACGGLTFRDSVMQGAALHMLDHGTPLAATVNHGNKSKQQCGYHTWCTFCLYLLSKGHFTGVLGSV